VWASFVRIATNRRIFETPTPVDEAFAFLHAVRGQPGHVAVVPGERHLTLFEELCRQAEAAGDLAPDAYLAAIALERGCVLASFDRDYARFERLNWRIPGESR
jgi:toxin-antitoxin system PIN domain toxin